MGRSSSEGRAQVWSYWLGWVWMGRARTCSGVFGNIGISTAPHSRRSSASSADEVAGGGVSGAYVSKCTREKGGKGVSCVRASRCPEQTRRRSMYRTSSATAYRPSRWLRYQWKRMSRSSARCALCRLICTCICHAGSAAERMCGAMSTKPRDCQRVQ